ncbi:MAG: hypothetical protein Ct9H300mP28_34200 [Pseudomonadota bacterium]|nr:MAG: hypothetical protein Ct9H300mP28_34200 [Pseudomonadota bacterium]
MVKTEKTYDHWSLKEIHHGDAELQWPLSSETCLKGHSVLLNMVLA